VGNSSTFLEQGLMITPRGYANKYSSITGEIKDGEKRGRSLSMGLDGWQECAREYLRDGLQQGSKPSLRDVMTYFDMPLGQILSAITAGSEEDTAGEFSAVAVTGDLLGLVQKDTSEWGRLRAVVRSEAGAVTELMLDAGDFESRGEWLNMENAHFHLHIHWHKVTAAWMLQRGDSLRSVHFVDASGDAVFNLSLIKSEGEFDVAALKHYQQIWQRQVNNAQPS